jgi:uncharacterized membrane protein YhfC
MTSLLVGKPSAYYTEERIYQCAPDLSRKFMNPLYITHPLNAFLMLLMPIGLGIYLTRRFNVNWRLFWIGGLTFVASQIGHIPFNSYLLNPMLRQILPGLPEGTWQMVVTSLFVGLSAGLWEEIARYIVYARFIPEARSWRKGLLFGAGHGGIEAMILGFLVFMSFLNLFALRGRDLSQFVPGEQIALAQQQVEFYWNMPWPNSILGAVERLFAIPLHLACALLVLQSFTRRQIIWVWLAVGWHTLVDAIAVFLVQVWRPYPWNAFAVEGVLGLLALVSLAIIFKLHQPEPEEPAPAESSPTLQSYTAAQLQLEQPEETSENLEKSRYN